ncbi:hypothetical protein HK101_011148, partial [Irineochytrium annulatum]
MKNKPRAPRTTYTHDDDDDDAPQAHNSSISRSSSHNTFDSSRKFSYNNANSTGKLSPAAPSRRSTASTPNPSRQLRVLYDFDAEGPGELTIRKGDIINLTVEIDEGWWEGELADGSGSGMFPSNYVEVIEDAPAPTTPVMPSRPLSVPRTSTSN